MNSIRFAAIDIGSNAVRLLIMSVVPEDPNELFTKVQMIRVPLRLGQESFITGRIDEKKSKQLIRLMKSFKHLMKVYEVTDYRACATSAMRDAKNGKELVKEIKKETDLKIEIIDGQEEASIINENHFADNLNKDANYAFVDVGGGSTEISLFVNGEIIQSKSYNIGTVRLLNDKVEPEEYDHLFSDLAELKEQYKIFDIIGSGGNIIKLYALGQVHKNNKLSLTKLESVYELLKLHTVDELITQYNLKPDRADVITHAAGLYIEVAKRIGARSFIVPRTGLADGLIHMLYEKWKLKNDFTENFIA